MIWVALTQSKLKIRSVSDPYLYQINTETITFSNQSSYEKILHYLCYYYEIVILKINTSPTFTYSKQRWKNKNNVWNLFKVNNWTPEWRHWRRSAVFIVKFEQISQIVLVFSMLTLSKWIPAGKYCWISKLIRFPQTNKVQAPKRIIY